MADKKITQLNPLLNAASVDVFPIVSISGAETMKITFGDLMASPVPIGTLTPSTARFTTLTVASGVTVNNFSNDATLSGDSATTLPTQQAVKSYVDTQIGGLAPNKIWQDDSYVEVIDDGTNSAVISFVADSQLALSITPDGLSLSTGVTVNEISNDATLTSDSTTALVTEHAIKTYVDAQIADLSPNIIWQDDSYVKVVDDGTHAGQITIVADGSQVASFDTQTQTIGLDSQIILTDSIGIIPSGYALALSVYETGIALETGQTVNNISDDGTLSGDSTSTIVTERAIKEYVDNHSTLPDRIVNGLASAIVADSTSSSTFSVKVRDSYFGPDSTTQTDVYYFNDSTNVSSNWSNPGNMVDGNTSTFAQAGSAQGAYIQINTGNTTVFSSTKNIEHVEFRVYGRDGSGPNISAFNIYPVFNGTIQGNSQNLRSFLGPVRSWTPWIDITQDPNAPSTWTWNDVINLDTKVEAIIGNPGGGIGDVLEVNKIEIRVTYTESPSVIGSVEKFRVEPEGIKVETGAIVNEFSTDVTMADNSNKAIPTERAVKTYVDTQIQSVRNDLDLINIRHVNSDTTSVTGDVCLVDTNGGIVNIQMLEVPDGRIIIKKISMDANPIYVTTTPGSSIDGQTTFVIDVAYKSITFLSDGNAFYII